MKRGKMCEWVAVEDAGGGSVSLRSFADGASLFCAPFRLSLQAPTRRPPDGVFPACFGVACFSSVFSFCLLISNDRDVLYMRMYRIHGTHRRLNASVPCSGVLVLFHASLEKLSIDPHCNK